VWQVALDVDSLRGVKFTVGAQVLTECRAHPAQADLIGNRPEVYEDEAVEEVVTVGGQSRSQSHRVTLDPNLRVRQRPPRTDLVSRRGQASGE